MKTRLLIVDDEPLARQRLRDLLSDEPDVELVGEAGDGREAVAMIRKLKPDVVVLDIQMPEMDGFDVVRALGPKQLPAIIFATAFDRFAVKAFEVHAVDYLLKPFDGDRLNEALRRARERQKRESAAGVDSQIAALLAWLKPRAESPGRLLIKADGKVVVVAIAEIDWIESADNYVVLHVGRENHIQRETLSAMEAKLPSDRFIRISRSVLVNISRIRELQPLFHGEYAVILGDGTRLTLTRTYRDSLDRLGLA